MFDSVDSSSSLSSISEALLRSIRCLRGVDQWPVAAAEVLSCEWTWSSDGETGNYKIEFSYRIDDIPYYGSFALPGYGTARLFAAGETIDIQ